MTDTQNLAMHYVPTLAERLWRKFGYRYHLGDEPEGTEALPGWMSHGVRECERLRVQIEKKIGTFIEGEVKQ